MLESVSKPQWSSCPCSGWRGPQKALVPAAREAAAEDVLGVVHDVAAAVAEDVHFEGTLDTAAEDGAAGVGGEVVEEEQAQLG